MKLSVVILAKNEEKNIFDCIESVNFADEIIIVDDNSKDRTREVVESLNKKNIKIVKHDLEENFSAQRNFGLLKASGDWVLFLDADERASSKLVQEMKTIIQYPISSIQGYWIKRQDIMWGKELRHGEVGDIKLLRLAKKGSGKWSGKVHEVWNVKGKTAELRSSLNHYPHQSLREFIFEVDFYSTLRAQELFENHTQISTWHIIVYPKAKFIINYIIKLGFLDGIPGFIVAAMMSFHSFLVRSKLWLLNQK